MKIIEKIKNHWNLLSKKRKIFYGISLFLVCFIMVLPFFVQAATLADAILKLLASLLQVIAYGLGWIASKLMIALVFFATWSKYTKGITAVTEGWMVARDICNMFFIFILLIISFATIIGIESYSYKKWLGKVIIFAILINFSKTITGLLIDFSQIVMLTFVSGFKDATVNNFAKGLHLDKLMSSNPRQAGDTKVTDDGGNNLDIFIVMLLVCIMMVVLNVVLVIMIVMLVGRILSLWVLAILSPFAFLLQASPVGGKYANEWWQTLSKNLISGPILAMFIYLAMLTIQNSANVSTLGGNQIQAGGDEMNSSTGEQTDEQPFAIQKTSMILDFIIVIAMLIAAIKIAGSLGVMGSGFAGQAMNKLQNAGKSALKMGAAGVGAVTGANYLSKRFKAYKEIRKDRKDQKAYGDAQKFMDRTGQAKQRIGRAMQNPLRALSSDRNRIGRAFQRADQGIQRGREHFMQTRAGRALHNLNFAARARERAQETADTASHLSYARSMGVRNRRDLEGEVDENGQVVHQGLTQGLQTRTKNLNQQEQAFLENYRAEHVGSNVDNIAQIDRGTLNDEQRAQLTNLTNDRERINTEQGHVDGLLQLMNNPNPRDRNNQILNNVINDNNREHGDDPAAQVHNLQDVLANTRVLDQTINRFQERSEKDSRAAQGWTEFGVGASAVFRRALMATSFLAPFASALGGSFFGPLASSLGQSIVGNTFLEPLANLYTGPLASSAASWTMAAAATPGLTGDAGRALERSGQADVRDAANFLSSKVMDAAKRFEDMDTGMIERMRDDIRTSNVDYMAAQFQLLKRGLVNVDQIPQLLSDIQNRGADRNTLRSFEGEIRKQFPTEGRWLDADGHPLADGDRGNRQAELMRHNGVGSVLQGINSTGYTQETVRNAIRESRTPAELRADANRLSIEQQRGVAQVSHRILIEEGENMNIEDINKLTQFLSTSLSSNVNEQERQTMSQEAYDRLIGRDDIGQINTGDLLVNMNLNNPDLDQRQLLTNINPVEIGNMVRAANELGGERKTAVNDWLGAIRVELDGMIQNGNEQQRENAQRIMARLGQMENNAALNTMNNLALYRGAQNQQNNNQQNNNPQGRPPGGNVVQEDLEFTHSDTQPIDFA